MSYDTAHSLASSWVGLFAAVWFARKANRLDAIRTEENPQRHRRHTPSDQSPEKENHDERTHPGNRDHHASS